MRKFILLALMAVMLLAVPSAFSDAEGGDTSVLLDLGNGTTYWYEHSGPGDCAALTAAASEKNGLKAEIAGSSLVSLCGLSACHVGDQGCGWIFYTWAGEAWKASEPSSYTGGHFAWGFYPDVSITPAETLDNKVAWVMHRGDSSSSGRSDSHGTKAAVAPMEWYRTYTTGFVDSSIITAGNYLYHTTGGMYGASGTDRNPWVYCVDRFTGKPVWEFMMTYGQGYEVTSPVVVGDMLVVTATNWNVYCFDRFDGTLLHKLALEQKYPFGGNGDILWKGRTFFTGGTTPVYDSGALYFGTADGHVLAYSVTREKGFHKLWDYDPPATFSDGTYTGTKGCFYFHAPVISEADGKRMLFIGSYEGYLHALDSRTGKAVWVQRVIDLGKGNTPHPGTPGSVASVSATQDGRLIVECTDGGLSPQDGYVVCIDMKTGRGPGGSDCHWKLEVMCGGPVVTADGFYAYVGASANGQSEMEKADGSKIRVTGSICMFDLDGKVVWASRDYQLIKAALTLADGVLYANDYSSGRFYPSGGGVTAVSAVDGSEIWRLKLSPFSADSYSMVAATVIDGKIYVGNDYGAIYCISETAGPAYGDDGEIVLKNGLYHWSWVLLALLALLGVAFLKRFY